MLPNSNNINCTRVDFTTNCTTSINQRQFQVKHCVTLRKTRMTFAIFGTSRFCREARGFTNRIREHRIQRNRSRFKVHRRIIPNTSLRTPPFVVELTSSRSRQIVPRTVPRLFQILRKQRRLVNSKQHVKLRSTIFLLFPRVIFQHSRSVQLSTTIHFRNLTSVTITLKVGLSTRVFLFVGGLDRSIISVLERIKGSSRVTFHFVDPLDLFLLTLHRGQTTRTRRRSSRGTRSGGERRFLR